MEEIKFNQVVLRGCGIDIHRDSAVATISGEGITTETRSQELPGVSSRLMYAPKQEDIHRLRWLQLRLQGRMDRLFCSEKGLLSEYNTTAIISVKIP